MSPKVIVDSEVVDVPVRIHGSIVIPKVNQVPVMTTLGMVSRTLKRLTMIQSHKEWIKAATLESRKDVGMFELGKGDSAFTFYLSQGVCANAFGELHYKIRNDISREFVLAYPDKSDCSEHTCHPIGGPSIYDHEQRAGTLWKNEARWLYVDFAITYCLNLIEKLKNE